MLRYHILIPAAAVADVNSTMEQLGGGPGCVSIPLSADGADPATHYAASGVYDPDQILQNGKTLQQQFDDVKTQIPGADYDNSGGDFYSWIAGKGLTVIEAPAEE